MTDRTHPTDQENPMSKTDRARLASLIRKHDAAVAAKALREAADPWQDTLGDTPLFAPGVADWLHERADRIEREAGGSGADA